VTLSERIAERESCAVVACDRHRQRDSLFCAEHLNDMWANRLTRQEDGTFIPAKRWIPRDMTRSAA